MTTNKPNPAPDNDEVREAIANAYKYAPKYVQRMSWFKPIIAAAQSKQPEVVRILLATENSPVPSSPIDEIIMLRKAIQESLALLEGK